MAKSVGEDGELDMDMDLTDPESNMKSFKYDIGVDYSLDMDMGLKEWPTGNIATGESPRPIITWKNRRRMAWLCLVTMIVFVSVLAFTDLDNERIKVLEPIINTFLYVLGGVIVAYMGFTSLPFWGWGGGKGKR